MSTPPTGRASPTGPAFLGLILIAGLLGIPAALVAALFLAAVHGIETFLWHHLPQLLGASSPPWYLVLGLPVLGALIVLFARKVLPGDGGHRPLEGLNTTPTPISHGPGVALAALGTLPFGPILGPEAPVLALGSVVGMAASRIARANPRRTAVLSAAGSFSALSALFDGPIVAGLLMVEASLPMGAAALPLLLPGLVAAAIGYLVFVGFGSFGGLNHPGLLVPNLPAYQGLHLLDLLFAVLVGLAAALVITFVRRAATAIDALHTRRYGMPSLLIAGGLCVGAIALVAERLGASPDDVLFSGQSTVGVVATAGSASLVLVLFVAKVLGYIVSLGCGFRGGPIFPAIFLGVALASFPVAWFGVSPTLAIAVGAAAGMAAQTRLLFAPLVFAALLVGTGGFDAIPAVVLSSASAWLAMTALTRSALSGSRDIEQPGHPEPAAAMERP